MVCTAHSSRCSTTCTSSPQQTHIQHRTCKLVASPRRHETTGPFVDEMTQVDELMLQKRMLGVRVAGGQECWKCVHECLCGC